MVMQDSTTQGISFSIANTGENPATAVTISIPEQPGVIVSGARSSIIGNLDKGDFTTVTFQITPQKNTKEMTIHVDYTDTAGIRNNFEKKIAVNLPSQDLGQAGAKRAQTNTTSSKIIYFILGVVIGVVATLLIRKKKGAKHETK